MSSSDNVSLSSKQKIGMGNVLGEVRGEKDKTMLSSAFVETASYEALIHRNDYNFVVGRRGSGKSALFYKVSGELKKTALHLVEERPDEEHVAVFQDVLKKIAPDYRTARIITRLIWKAQLLTSALRGLRDNYKSKRLGAIDFIEGYIIRHKDVFDRRGTARSLYVLQQSIRRCVSPAELPVEIANYYELGKLQEIVSSALSQMGKRIVVLYDGLDEGWIPTPIATAILGGLAKIVADLADANSGVHCILFIRDNMFRALAQFDDDFTRNIEGSAMRLHWDEESLLALVAARLRVTLNLSGESDVKVWNRFAYRELRNREGFLRCLKYTLYRPRDIIVLLNKAYAVASLAGRSEIVESDLEATAASISKSRFEDLLKEYDEVLPGLGLFASIFHGRPAVDTYENVLKVLDAAVARNDRLGVGVRDFALLGSGREIFSALYSVGFLGAAEAGGERFSFCHDGNNSNISSLDSRKNTIVHPCYWKALEIVSELAPEDVLIQLDDEESETQVGPVVEAELQDLRVKRLGQVAEEFHRIPLGIGDAHHLERWVHSAMQMLFSESITHVELKPNNDVSQSRDLLATNMAERGFWKRVLQDYGVRQVVALIRNEAEFTEEDLRNAAKANYEKSGRLALLITRATNEGLTLAERKWIKDVKEREGKLILVVPAFLIARAQSKLRAKRKRIDYADELLTKRLDTYERSYL
ncbi:P-loop ATPase, Sll1717 family [Corallococcus sp. AB038B]|uniref:P-loop ATPase, Sll1717 family n=1 Tax=Corallococcus sp. AB038B TaxID=2316718 RepID=UPI0011C4A451|nr:hypothetical protein [Corallococcus sp. AB038B]